MRSRSDKQRRNSLVALRRAFGYHSAFAVMLGALTVGAAGCGTTGRTPKAALDEYAKALRDGDGDRAYELMSAEFRARYSREQFEQMLEDNNLETRSTVEDLRRESSNVTVKAEFEYGLGETMRLIKEDSGWRIDSNPLEFYSQATPEEAVRSFVRAFQLKRWDVMMRFIPKSYQERTTVEMVQEQFEGPLKEEMTAMMEALKIHLGEPISSTVKSNQARLRYTDEFEVHLVKEQGRWKIAK